MCFKNELIVLMDLALNSVYLKLKLQPGRVDRAKHSYPGMNLFFVEAFYLPPIQWGVEFEEL